MKDNRELIDDLKKTLSKLNERLEQEEKNSVEIVKAYHGYLERVSDLEEEIRYKEQELNETISDLAFERYKNGNKRYYEILLTTNQNQQDDYLYAYLTKEEYKLIGENGLDLEEYGSYQFDNHIYHDSDYDEMDEDELQDERDEFIAECGTSIREIEFNDVEEFNDFFNYEVGGNGDLYNSLDELPYPVNR